MDRRELLASSGAFILGFGLDAAQADASASTQSLNGVLADHAQQLLRQSPELATSLGLDNGKNADLERRLDDRSWSAVVRSNAQCAERLKDLATLDRSKFTNTDTVNFDAAVYANRLGQEASRFEYGNNTIISITNEANTPYIISQQTGAFVTVPDFLDSQHKVENADGADAYLLRLSAFSKALDQDTDRCRRDAGLGVIPPDYILAAVLEEMRSFRATPGPQSSLVTSVAKRAAAAGVPGDYARHAGAVVEHQVYPALDRQIALLESLHAKSSHEAGVWRLPDGEAYYAWSLKVGTSTALTAQEVHQGGLEQTAAITARMDQLLAEEGLTRGTVAERMMALCTDPRNLYADTNEGRVALIDYLNGRIANIRPRMPQISKLVLKAPVIVKRVPVEIEAGQPLGYMVVGALDGSRPSLYYINLHDMQTWPRFILPSLTYHETIPGHAWQGAFIAERHTLPLFNTMLNFNAYVEGWALYAEQLADEMGLYDDDPLGRLGYLQLQLLRASRLVADTGLHAMRWSREQTITWMAAASGEPTEAVASEVDRYCSGPGQACGYQVGHKEILRLRDKAKAAKQGQFDLRDFNDAVVTAGAVPLTVLADVIDRYIAEPS